MKVSPKKNKKKKTTTRMEFDHRFSKPLLQVTTKNSRVVSSRTPQNITITSWSISLELKRRSTAA